MKCLQIEKVKNTVIKGDCLKTLKRFPDSSIPLIVTSPPYNMRNTSGNWPRNGNGQGKWTLSKYENYDDCLPSEMYIEWQRNFIKEAMRVLKDDGALFYNHKWRIQKGLLEDRNDIVKDYPVRQIIIWSRKGGLNFNRSYFLPTYEVIYLIAKPKFSLNKGSNTLTDVWTIPPEKKNPHPAPFPLEIPLRCIKSTSAPLVLDPFAGSGTTAIAAKSLGRNYICIETSADYCKQARARIKQSQT